jgi:hypothetical protein
MDAMQYGGLKVFVGWNALMWWSLCGLVVVTGAWQVL